MCANPRIKKLQGVQNAAARKLCQIRKYDHITPVLHELHWLLVEKRIEYIVILLTYKILHRLAPKYLTDLIGFYEPSRTLRSTSQCLLSVPSSRLKTFGDKAFSVQAPKLWNSLPPFLRNINSLDTFKSNLKTYLFQAYFAC